MKLAPLLAIGATLVVGLAGYAITGSPGLPSAPAAMAAANPRLTPEAEQASVQLLEKYGDVRIWLTASDAFIRAGRTETAAFVLNDAIERIPGNVDLWAQLGVALVAHADGEMAPAARLAFDRASRIDPDHPAPYYFLGLSWLQAAEPEKALAVWEELDARTPPDAAWKPMLDRLMRGARAMIRMGVSPETPTGSVASAGADDGAE